MLQLLLLQFAISSRARLKNFLKLNELPLFNYLFKDFVVYIENSYVKYTVFGIHRFR